MNILTGSQNDDSRLDLAVAYRDGNSNTILWLSVCIKTLVSIFVIVALSADTYGSSHRQRETTWFELSTVSSARAVTTEPVQAQFQAQCNPRTGLSAPLGLCTSASPCRHQKGQFVISSIDQPSIQDSPSFGTGHQERGSMVVEPRGMPASSSLQEPHVNRRGRWCYGCTED
jgi:hypothetical protein